MIQKKIVRVLYTYDDKDRGGELSYYITDSGNKQSGKMIIVQNDGTETQDEEHFFTIVSILLIPTLT